MSYNRNNFMKVKEQYRDRHKRAVELAEAKKLLLYREIPGLEEVDRELSLTGVRIFEIALSGAGDVKEQIAELEKQNLALQKKRSDLLASKGYASTVTDPVYQCEKCKDMGFTDSVMCECFRRELIRASLNSSGLGALMLRQTFETFRTDYYNDDPRALSNIKFVLSQCRDFAENFGNGESRSLLFMGGTGLGKTHLSTAVAVRVIDRGYDVVYETAQNMIADFEHDRFSRENSGDEEKRTDRYFSCDLLVIDDLGTEVSNQFTVACLYNIINTRLIRGSSMIINTNLSKDELRRRYADRITSRLFGEFQPLLFMGTDIRAKKLAEK